MSRLWRPRFDVLHTLQLSLRVDLQLNSLMNKPLSLSAADPHCNVTTLHGGEKKKKNAELL